MVRPPSWEETDQAMVRLPSCRSEPLTLHSPPCNPETLSLVHSENSVSWGQGLFELLKSSMENTLSAWELMCVWNTQDTVCSY